MDRSGQRALYTRTPFILRQWWIIAGGGGGGDGGNNITNTYQNTNIFSCHERTTSVTRTNQNQDFRLLVAVEEEELVINGGSGGGLGGNNGQQWNRWRWRWRQRRWFSHIWWWMVVTLVKMVKMQLVVAHLVKQETAIDGWNYR